MMWNPRRYLANLLAYNMVMLVLSAIMLSLLGFLASVLAAAFLPVALAAMNEGQKYAARQRQVPEPSAIWRAGCAMAEVYLTVLVVATAVLALISAEFRGDLATANLFALFVFYGSFTGIALVVIRFAYAFGARLQLDEGSNHTG